MPATTRCEGGLGADTMTRRRRQRHLRRRRCRRRGDRNERRPATGGDRVESDDLLHARGRTSKTSTSTAATPINGTGNALNNVINGNDGNNQLFGGGGNDTLNGDDGNDLLDGGNGNDTLNGGDDNDTIIGGAGNDTIDVGGGFNTIVYNAAGFGNDTINSFDAAAARATTRTGSTSAAWESRRPTSPPA